MEDIPTQIKRLLREQQTRAYEEELRRALLPLAAAFDEWRAGNMNSFDLGDVIHEFHQETSRDLYERYNYGDLRYNVAYAIVTGVLVRDQVPLEVLSHISNVIEFYEQQEADSADDEQSDDEE
ncbi:MAG: hypothetical protein JNJ50_21255 [Acidobacteria bacterium]|nr:hypothetical protein [Acidobacteriota bacterium]